PASRSGGRPALATGERPASAARARPGVVAQTPSAGRRKKGESRDNSFAAEEWGNGYLPTRTPPGWAGRRLTFGATAKGWRGWLGPHRCGNQEGKERYDAWNE